MRTLERSINRKYSEFNLSNEAFTHPRSDWRNFVPLEIKQIWHLLQEDERFLIALTAEVAADMQDYID